MFRDRLFRITGDHFIFGQQGHFIHWMDGWIDEGMNLSLRKDRLWKKDLTWRAQCQKPIRMLLLWFGKRWWESGPRLRPWGVDRMRMLLNTGTFWSRESPSWTLCWSDKTYDPLLRIMLYSILSLKAGSIFSLALNLLWNQSWKM